MPYNHAEAEIKWAKFVEELRDMAEEECSEEEIVKLIEIYREDFKKDRSFYEHERSLLQMDIENHPVFPEFTNETYQDLLDSVPDHEIYEYCKNTNEVMRSIIIFVLKGFKIKEIAEMLNMTPKAVSKRFTRFIKNIPKPKD